MSTSSIEHEKKRMPVITNYNTFASTAHYYYYYVRNIMRSLLWKWDTRTHTSLINLSRELVEGLNQVPNTRAFLVSTPLPCSLEETYPRLLITNTHKPKFICPIHELEDGLTSCVPGTESTSFYEAPRQNWFSRHSRTSSHVLKTITQLLIGLIRQSR